MKKAAKAEKIDDAQFEESLIKNIKESKNRVFWGMTGGGSLAVSKLLHNGGASTVFVGATIPYAEEVLRWIVGPFAKAVSFDVAKKLSNSFPDVELEEGQEIISIGLTCSLAKHGTEREGRLHQVYLVARRTSPASHGDFNTSIIESISIQLKKKRTREEEEELTARLILAYSACYMNLTIWHPITYNTMFNWIGLSEDDVVLTYRDKQEEQS